MADVKDVKINLHSSEDGAKSGVGNGGGSVSYHKGYSSPPPKELESLNNALCGSQGSLCNGASAVSVKPGALRKVPNSSPNNHKRPMISLTHLPKRPPVDIQFLDLSYSVSEGRKRGYKTILKCINGKFRSSELTAIMGPSGAGKSTLMNILAGYRTSNINGSVLINGKERSLKKFRKMSCYIMQDDCLQPHLTVKEAMTVAANLKIGKDLTKADKKVVIGEIMETIGLQDCKNTMTTSLSGGQRKRLSIALELVNNPPVMFFDEPTSGLDSSSCFQCLSLLKSLARGGRTVICTIHQPSARLFEMFDHLYMLAEGQCIYRGQVSGLVPFLGSMGLECPSYHNPADYVMEVACGEHGDYVQKLVIAVNAGRCNNYIQKTPESNGNGISNVLPKDKTTAATPNGVNTQAGATCTTSLLDSSENLPISEKKVSFPTSSYLQFWILLKRTFFTILRDSTLTRMRLIAHFVIGILLGLIYYNIGTNAAKVTSNAGCIFFTVMFTMFAAMMPTILTFPLEMSVFMREHLNYWYSVKSYYLAKTLADIPFQIILTVSFIVGVYYLTSQPMEPVRFGMVVAIGVLTALVSQSFGLLIGAAFNIEAGVFLGPITTIPMVLFSGFFAKLGDIPPYLSWLSYVTYVRYSFEGTMIAIYGLDREKLECNEMYCHFKYPKKFLGEMAMNDDLNTYLIDLAALAGFFVIVRVFAYFSLRVKIFTNR
ncbi:ATP-binding cassette sub-family G member 4-like [Onthophagus taurus]|uniref:ATP-binding cassette sub-family G member 4-like n=1 Tax=Onthophagus taurus TaxID=166361 RepID=UPI000C205E4E|nr:ATP-binding cassette sub-family G member 4-like [Onthophagus taurus]XP_022912480.1 ATP-binding cassette sub-family G member 4-like [Onthophagus taurus]